MRPAHLAAMLRRFVEWCAERDSNSQTAPGRDAFYGALLQPICISARDLGRPGGLERAMLIAPASRTGVSACSTTGRWSASRDLNGMP